MKRTTPLVIAALAIVLLAGRRKASAAGMVATPADGGGSPMTPDELKSLYASMGLPDDWQAFLLATARRESRFNPSAVNSGDASAARRGWERNRAKYENCNVPPERYQVGAVGLYQLLPTSGMEAFVGTPLQCADPIETLSDPRLATIAALEYARRVMRWQAWKDGPQTWTALAAAWASPGLARDPPDKYRQRLVKHLRALGLNEALADAMATPPPRIEA